MALFDAHMVLAVMFDPNQSNLTAHAKTSFAQRNTTQYAAVMTSLIRMNALCTITPALKGRQSTSHTRVSVVSLIHPFSFLPFRLGR